MMARLRYRRNGCFSDGLQLAVFVQQNIVIRFQAGYRITDNEIPSPDIKE